MLFNKISGNKVVLTIATALSAKLALAGDAKAHPWKDQPSFVPKYVVAIAGGPIWENAGRTQTLYLAPNIVKTYVANSFTSTLAEGELFFGIVRPLRNGYQYQVGVALATTSNAQLSGIIWDDANPAFDNYAYEYQLNHTHLALKGKLLADKGYYVMPWVSISLGVAFNQAQFYNNLPVIQQAVVNANFAYNIKTAFTYTAGIGVQKNVTDHLQLGVGYEFSDWGPSNLGVAPAQTYGTGLSLNHFYTNGLIFNATYLV